MDTGSRAGDRLELLLKEIGGYDEKLAARVRSFCEEEIGRTSEILQESENNLRHVLSGNADNFYVVDRFYHVTLINEAAERNLEKAWRRKVTIGTNILDVIPSDTSEPILQSFRAVFSGKQVEYELPINIKGLPTWVLVHYSPVTDSDGLVTGAYVTTRNISERKQAEKEKLEAEAKFRHLVEKSLVGVYIIQHGRFAYVNPFFAEIFGYEQTELNTIPLLDLIYEPDRPLVEENIRKRMEGEADSIRYEFRARRKDGSLAWIEAFGSRTQFNGSMAVIGTLSDITDRKNANEALLKSEERYRTLVENATEALVVYDMAIGRMVSVSESALRLFKMTREEMLQIGPVDLSPVYQPDGRLSAEKAREKLQEAVDGGKPFFEWVHKDSEGRLIPCEIWLVRLPSDDQLLVRGSIIDITERKRIEEEREKTNRALQQSEANLHAIFDTTDTVYVLVDKDLRLKSYNHAALKFAKVELDKDAATGTFLMDYFPLHRRGELMRNINEVLRGAVVSYETKYAQPDGSIHWYGVKMFPTANKENRIHGFLVTMLDLTEKKAMEKRMLEQKVREQRRITRAMIRAEERERNKIGQELHDNVNQILASTNLYLAIARDHEEERLEFVLKSIDLLNDAIQEIRMLSHQHVTPLKRINLKDLVQSLANDLVRNSGLQISLQYKIPPQVRIDNDLKLNLYRILQEQLNNILKHADASEVNVHLSACEQNLQMVVSDNGVGFEIKKKKKGIGITNIINRVESFNGEIILQSEPTKGCRIDITIPLV